MIVVDTSAFISIAVADVLGSVLATHNVHTTRCVISELETTADYDDVHGSAATRALEQIHEISVHNVNADELQTSQIDRGEASCVRVSQQSDADFLITDDLRALPELQQLTDAQVAISPILLRALVKQDCLTNQEAKARVEKVAAARDWLGAPIYRRAQQLFDR